MLLLGAGGCGLLMLLVVVVMAAVCARQTKRGQLRISNIQPLRWPFPLLRFTVYFLMPTKCLAIK